VTERAFRRYYCPTLKETIRIDADDAKGPGRERIVASKIIAENSRKKCPLKPLGKCDCEITWLCKASNKEVWGDFA